MKKIKVILFVIILIFFTLPVYANGGPGGGTSLLVGGNISFENTPDIFAANENLYINISPYTAVVTVEYTLKNTGAAREIDYIFPVTNYLDHLDWRNGDDASIEWIVFYDGNGK